MSWRELGPPGGVGRLAGISSPGFWWPVDFLKEVVRCAVRVENKLEPRLDKLISWWIGTWVESVRSLVEV